MIFIIFSLGVALIFALANLYIYKRFMSKILFFKPFKKLFLLIFVLLFFTQAFFICFRSSEFLSDFWYGLLATFYAPTYCLFFTTLLFDFLKLFFDVFGKKL